MEERISQNQVYAEVYAVLTALGGEYIRKLPRSVLNVIAEGRDVQYERKINQDMPLEEQNLSKEAIAMLASLKLDYWCETEEEKKALRGILNLNEEKQSGGPLSKDSKKAWIEMLKNRAKK
ncbi:MAG: hypothetical protein IJ870_04690 [Alphaproteobacteria bacterium]|nr:hypothetical protein [Alphaproteobacteria bacterium]